MINLGWVNDIEVQKKISELIRNGVVFEHTKYDRTGYDNVYTSTDGQYCYHVDSSD